MQIKIIANNISVVRKENDPNGNGYEILLECDNLWDLFIHRDPKK